MKKLKKGDTIGLVSPANSVDLEKLKSAAENLERFGFKVKLAKNADKSWYSFAGTDLERANDINEFFRDDEVDTIMCVRGGYGGIRLLNHLDYELIKKNPKPFIGYSDITSMHMAFSKKCNLKTYHGPMAASNFSGDYDEKTLNHFLKVMEKNEDYHLENFSKELKFYNSLSSKGELIGGNLAVLVSSLGTEFDYDYTGKILFLEDIGESTYKIDRMLWQLKNFGVFEKISGVILGDFANCEKSADNDMSLKDVFDSHFEKFDKPVISNLESGHCTPMLTLEFGKILEIDGVRKTILVKSNV